MHDCEVIRCMKSRGFSVKLLIHWILEKIAAQGKNTIWAEFRQRSKRNEKKGGAGGLPHHGPSLTGSRGRPTGLGDLALLRPTRRQRAAGEVNAPDWIEPSSM